MWLVPCSILLFDIKSLLIFAQRKTLREWHKADPVDARKEHAMKTIVALQKKRNPFIDHPEYVDQISDFKWKESSHEFNSYDNIVDLSS